MNQYYRVKTTGRLVTGKVLDTYADIGLGDPYPLVEELEKLPTVIDCLRDGCFSMAVGRYQEIHPDADIKTAISNVKTLKYDMSRMRGKYGKQ